ncbi:endolytic transglycosylase MltG [Microbacterium paludicola]|uniref:endolytic transglycosylase MltG n=1 Tax=Microbacterium paludicola TaxID=300019 RepID=UPI0031D8334B
MTDPSRESTPPEASPMTRRQARESARAPQAPSASATPEGDASGVPTAGDPVSAARAMPWDDGIFVERTPATTVTPAAEATPPAERSAPATLAETAALASQAPAPSGPEPASLEDLFVPENTVEPKRRGGRGCLVTLVILLAILGGIVAGGMYVWNTYGTQIAERFGWDGPSDYEAGEATGEAIITIEEGDGGEAISQTLYEAGVTLKPDSFYDHLLDADAIPTFYPGIYRLQQKMTSEAALAALADPANKLENTVALQEGWTVSATLEAASTGLDMPLEELQAAAEDPSAYGVEADSLEGWLFPATYTFDPGVTAEDVIKTMVDRTRESLANAGVAAGDEQRILTVASIVQREGASREDFGMVAQVIYNRLDPEISDTNGLLQMDSTAQFGYRAAHPEAAEQGSVFSSEEQLNDPNPWNTYVHPGLPVGPIANPGDEAIQAAQQPTEGGWQYFVTVNLETGETLFAETYAEQQQNEAQLHAWCADNPDHGGCGG